MPIYRAASDIFVIMLTYVQAEMIFDDIIFARAILPRLASRRRDDARWAFAG